MCPSHSDLVCHCCLLFLYCLTYFLRLRGLTDGGYRRGQDGTTCDKFVAATRQQRVDLRGWDQKEGYLPAVFEDDAAASRTHSESWMTKTEFVSLPEDTLGQRRDLLWFSQCA